MNILTISNYYPEHTGGIEYVALNLVQKWRQRHSVHWMACNVKRNPHSCEPDDIPLRASNFTEERLGFPFPIPSPHSISFIFQQVRWCDLAHIHDCLYPASLYTYVASRIFHKPLVVTQHIAIVPYRQAYKNFLQRIAYGTVGKMVLRNAEGVVFINKGIMEWFEKRIRFQQYMRLINNGVDRKMFYPTQGDERDSIRARMGFSNNQNIALFVGRFTEKKGLNVIRQIAYTRPKLFWVMIGAGEIDPNTWNLPNVRVLPPQAQNSLRDFYITADIFILPSVGEGLPLVVQEALSCGLPVAVSGETATNLSDAPLISLDISNLSSVLYTLDTLLTDLTSLDDIKRNSVEYAKRWDWGSVATEYESLFEQIQR